MELPAHLPVDDPDAYAHEPTAVECSITVEDLCQRLERFRATNPGALVCLRTLDADWGVTPLVELENGVVVLFTNESGD